MKIKNAIILAAGNSTRFGENKLHKKIKEFTLPQRILKFCIKNEITNVYVTIRKEDFYLKNHRELCHPIIEDLERHALYTVPFKGFPGIESSAEIKNINLNYAFQNPNEYGPAAGIKPWKNIVKGSTIVLFGDNFYNMEIPDFEWLTEDTVYVSYINKTVDPRNLQLATIVDNYVIEKPHPFLSGEFFCGYIVFNSKSFKNLDKINKSGRNEYEITDFINSFKNRSFIEIKENEWADLTYQSDITNIINIIENGKV